MDRTLQQPDKNPYDEDGTVHGAPVQVVQGILRKLRDLNLHVRGLRLDGQRSIRVEGCLSPDAPVEAGMSYRLRLCDGREARLDLIALCGALEFCFFGLEESPSPRRIQVVRDAVGQVIAPELRGRLHPAACDPRRVEHFLRRVVRGAFALQQAPSWAVR